MAAKKKAINAEDMALMQYELAKSGRKPKKKENWRVDEGELYMPVGEKKMSPKLMTRTIKMDKGERTFVQGHIELGPKPCPHCGDWHDRTTHASHGFGSFARTHNK